MFPKISEENKTPDGIEALNENNLICRTLRNIKKKIPEILVFCDVALDPYTTTGHDGIVNKKGEIDNLEIDKNDYSITISIILIIIGIACLVFGADLLVDSAINIARTYNVPASVIGLSLVAFGTSLPELAVGIVSAFRKKIDFALGNILGSNIYNVLGVLGISSFFGNFKVPAVLANQDLYFMLSITALILMFMIFAKKIGRIYGIIGLTLYFGYMYFIYI